MVDASDTGMGEGAGGPTRTAYVVAASLAVAGGLWIGVDGYASHAAAVAGVGLLVLLVRAARVDTDGGDEDEAGADAAENGDEQSDEESTRDRRDKEMSVGDGHTV